MDEHALNADDIRKIYDEIESKKQGLFIIEEADQKPIPPNHISPEAASLYEGENYKKTLEEDADLAGRLVKELIANGGL